MGRLRGNEVEDTEYDLFKKTFAARASKYISRAIANIESRF